MADDIRTRWVKNLCTFIDFSEPEDKLYQRILIVVFVLIEGRETTITVLIVLHPTISLIQTLRVQLKERSSFVMLHHFANDCHQHACIINIRNVLEFLSIGNPSILLQLVIDQVFNNWMQFLRGFARLKQGKAHEDRVPKPSIAKAALVWHSLHKV